MMKHNELKTQKAHLYKTSLLCILNKKLYAIALMALILTGSISAQDNSITGTITSATDNAPVIGASVKEKGTSNGVITDLNGAYKLKLTTTAAVIEVSFLGFNTETVEVKGQSVINVSLTENITELNEVVVVGYGTVKKSDLTGSVSSIKAKDIEKQPITQIGQALQGRASGVMVQNTSGAPGADIKIRVRGMNSIYGDNEPLYIVDGIATEPGSLNTNDIESFEILKDASSTAIYGSRGANGVILITTKKGQKGKTAIDFDMNLGFDQIPNERMIETLGPVEFMKVNKEIGTAPFTDADIAAADSSGVGTNWKKELFRSGYTRNYQLSVRGGSENISYYASGNYINQSGTVINTGQEKYSLRANIDSKLNERITLSFNNNISYKEIKNGGLGGLHNVLIWSPNLALRDSLGEFTVKDNVSCPDASNPIDDVTSQNNTWGTTYIDSKADLKINIIPGLTFNPVIGIGHNVFEEKRFSGKVGPPTSTSRAGIKNESRTTLQNSNILTYNKTFNNFHELTVTAVNEWTTYKFYKYDFGESGIPTEDFGIYQLGTGTFKDPISSEYSANQLLSYLGRVNYSYKSKYLFTGSYRADASSKFKGNNKWGYFPSAAVSWKASEESFIKNLNLFNSLKIRLSYGETGSQAIQPYGTMALVGTDPKTFSYPDVYDGKPLQLHMGKGLGDFPNPNLKWETTKTLNAGIDMSYFKGRMNLSIDVFNKNTVDMLYKVRVAGYLGGGQFLSNVGTNNNKGIEINIDAYPINLENFKWNTTFNLSFIKNEITELADSALVGPGYWGNIIVHRTEKGKPASSFYLYQYDGVWKTADSAQAKLFGSKPGDTKIRDINNNGKRDEGDLGFKGSPYPNVYWGWTNNFTYKNWELSIFINGSEGAKLFNMNYLLMATKNGWSATITSPDVRNRWDPVKNPNSNFPLNPDGQPYNSTRYLQDASYIKIKNVSLSYGIKKKWLIFSDLKINGSVQNAFIFTKYTGYDPESIGWSQDNKEIYTGFDAGVYPSARAYTLGIKASF